MASSAPYSLPVEFLNPPNCRFPITENRFTSARHSTYFLTCGPSPSATAANSPVMMFVHGWPELSYSWRHQIQFFASLGFYCVAPDMRGYGGSSTYGEVDKFALEESVKDLLDLLDHLECKKCVLVGHDWGAPPVWQFASHHPDRLLGLVNLCVPYFPKSNPASFFNLVDRTIYPAEEFPLGQWDYVAAYNEMPDVIEKDLSKNIPLTIKALFRRGDPASVDKPALTAFVRRRGFMLGPMPDIPHDPAVVSEADVSVYTAALTRNGFFGPSAWYRNNEKNQKYNETSVGDGKLEMPVLFIHAAYDSVCATVNSRLAEPMRGGCSKLSESTVYSGHWAAQEKPQEVNAAILKWICSALPEFWPEAKPMA